MDIKTQFAGDPQFLRLCTGAEEVDLIGLMLELATDAYPHMDRPKFRAQIRQLSCECRQPLKEMVHDLYGYRPALREAYDAAEASPEPVLLDPLEARPLLMALVAIFHKQLGFSGDNNDYYHPDNSYLNRVLERRQGIPISLSVLFRELAAQCGLTLFGVATPGHFVLGYPAEEPLYVDAFAGEVLTRPELRAKVERLTGEPLWRDDVFLPASHLSIAARVLRNLKGAYARQENWPRALTVQRRLALLLPELADEQRDLGLLLVRDGQAWPALEILEPYIQQRPQEAESLEPFLRAARRMSVQWN